MASAISASLTDDLAAAYAGAVAESASALDMADGAAELLVDEIRGFVALTGGGWPVEQRQEFIDQALVELADVPFALVVPAIRAARRTIWDPKRFVPWIFDAIKDDISRLRAERDRIGRLLALAQQGA